MASPIRILGGDNPHVQDNFQVTTDAKGQFKFDRLPPVPTRISSVLSAWRDYPITSNESTPIDLQPGQTHQINLGGEGVQITGRVKLRGDTADKIEFRYGLNSLASAEPSISIPDHAKKGLVFETGEQKLFEERLWGDLKTKAGKKSYFVKLNDDGSFRSMALTREATGS